MLLISAQLFAQLSISGRVLESGSKEPLAYASVVLKKTMKGTTTNLSGFFTLYGIPADSSTILISYVGYEVLEIRFAELKKNGSDVELQPLTTSLNEVVVHASSNKFINVQEDVSKVRISTKQISALPSVGEVDLFRSLQLLPGVSATNESSSGLYVRGGTPDQNLVLLDGMTVYKVDHFYGFFSAFNANAIKDVQLYKGAFPAKYGGRLSSVVDMTGKVGSFEKVKGAFGLNFISANGTIQVPIGKKVSVLVSARRSYTDVLQSDLYKKISGTFNDTDQQFRNLDFNELEPAFYFYDLNGKLSFRPSEKDLISLSGYLGKDYLDQSRDLLRIINFGARIPNRNASLEINEFTNWGNKAASLKWSRQWNDQWYSNLLIAGSEYFSDYDVNGHFQLTIPSEDSLVNEVNVSGVERNRVKDMTITLDNELQLNADHKLSFGAAHTITDITYSAIRDDTITLLVSDQNSSFTSIYLTDHYEAGSRVVIEAGLRGSYYEQTDKSYLSPRLSLTYLASQHLKFKAGFGQYYQIANRILNETVTEGTREFWILADGDLIGVSKSKHYIFGMSYEKGGWLVDIEGFLKDLDGLNEYTLRNRSSEDYIPEELFYKGESRAQGFEFLIQKKSGNFSGWLSYTLSQVVNDFPELNEGQKYYALHDQRHEAKLVMSYDIGDWLVSANFVYGSGKAYSEPDGFYNIGQLNGDELQFISVGGKNASRLPPYHRLDIAVHHKFDIGSVKADLGVSLFNLYNHKNTWYYKYDFTQQPYLKTEVQYLGFVPNVSFNISF